MRRRMLLGTVASGAGVLAGCPTTGQQADPTVSSQEGADSPARSDSDPPGRRGAVASVIDLGTANRTYSLSPTIQRIGSDLRLAVWFQQTATLETPAEIRGWLNHEADDPGIITSSGIPGVGRTTSEPPEGHDPAAALHLVPTAGHDLVARAPSFRLDEKGYWRVDKLGEWLPDTIEFGDRGWLELRYAVVGAPDHRGRPTGDYVFPGEQGELTISVWADENTQRAVSRFSGRSVPSVGSDSPTSWYHTRGSPRPLVVRPDRERVTLDATVQFEAANTGDETVNCGEWGLYKLVDRTWYYIGPVGPRTRCRELPPGNDIVWTLHAYNTDPKRLSGPHEHQWTRGHLGGGLYAVVFDDTSKNGQSGCLIACVGEPVSVEPTADVDVTYREDTAIVTTPVVPDGSETAEDGFELIRTPVASQRYIPEQLMGSEPSPGRRYGLRNAVAHTRADIARVVVRGDASLVDAVIGPERTVHRFRFAGSGYAVRRSVE